VCTLINLTYFLCLKQVDLNTKIKLQSLLPGTVGTATVKKVMCVSHRLH